MLTLGAAQGVSYTHAIHVYTHALIMHIGFLACFSFCKTGLSGHGWGLCQCGAGDQQLTVLCFVGSLYTVHDFLMMFE